MAFCAPGETESRIEIFERDYIPAVSVDMLLYGVESYAMPRILRLEIVGFSQHVLALNDLDFAKMRDLGRVAPQAPQVLDQSADRFGFGAREIFFLRESEKNWVEFSLAKIGVFPPLPFDLGDNFLRPETFALRSWSSRFIIQRLRLFPALVPFLFPVKERAPFDLKGLDCRLKAALFPEDQYLRFLLRLFGNHIPVA